MYEKLMLALTIGVVLFTIGIQAFDVYLHQRDVPSCYAPSIELPSTFHIAEV